MENQTTPATTGHTKLPWGIEETHGRIWVGTMRADGFGKLYEIVYGVEVEGLKPEARARHLRNANDIVAAMNAFNSDASLRQSHARLLGALKDLIFAAENADETGYVTDVGFIDLDAIYKAAHAAIASAQRTKETTP